MSLSRETPVPRPVRVSYIISTRNRAQHLSKTLDNVREFITPEDELLVMDGASTDNTADVVKANSDIVTVFRSEPDIGEAHGFNKGLLASRGEFIKPLTDDDYIFPEAIREAIAVMESHPGIDVVQCGGEGCRFDASTGRLLPTGFAYLPPERSLTDIQCVHRFVPCGVGLILTRRCLEKVGLFDTTCRMVDVEYMSRIILAGAVFRYLNVKLYRHATYPHSGYLLHTTDDAREKARVFLGHRRWEVLMDFPPSIVGETLGLNRVHGGEGLTSLIFLLEAARRRVPWPFKAVAGPRRFLSSVRSALKHSPGGPVLKQLRDGLKRRDGASHPPVEPHWDGSLR